MDKLFSKNTTYPKPSNKNIQAKIYKKREFYSHKIQPREQLNTYEEIKEYRDKICGKEIVPHEYQTFLSKYINPNTPYRGLLIFHGVGSGKTCGSIKIAENFKPLVEKYGTKIHVLVPGSLVKENWKNEIIKCTGNTYLKVKNTNDFQSKIEQKKSINDAYGIMNKYYKFISYKSFHKKVLGEKIKEKVKVNNKFVKKFRKTKDGDFERDISVDRIDSLNNSLIIIDEAHHLTDNDVGNALLKVINNSVNLKIVLLTATPMKNLADDIIYLLNFIRPKNDKIARDKVFTTEKGHKMRFKEDGIKYLKDMTRGYVSYVRGADPLTFAEKVDKGEIPPGLLFTRLIRCKMLDFQLNMYNKVVDNTDDALDKRTTSVSNFVFPGIENNKIIGLFGTDGINQLKNQLKTYSNDINNKIKSDILNIKNDNMNYIMLDNDKIITGKFLESDNLKYFSIKFYTILKKLNKLVDGIKGSGTAFIYSNYVKVGVEIFEQILIQNGYLEFNEDQNNYNIKPTTKCYFCGKEFKLHPIPNHQFYPITFISITGSTDDNIYAQHEDKMRIINIFNNINNKEGKYIKFILGSQVMSESITLENIKEVHIIDAHYHLGRVDQVIGRAIRYCKHYSITNEKNPYPKVNIYRYVVSIDKGLSTEENLYKKAELKYKLIKKVEHILKTNAVDCPLFRNINMFPEEIEEYKDCGTVDKPCPVKCNFTSCNYKCDDNTLNELYYDKKTNLYNDIKQEDLDISTFNNKFARDEIEYIKKIINKLFKLKNYYLLEDIVENVYNLYDKKKRNIYDKKFTYYALTELMPQSENDFNNFNDIIYNKFNEPGYIIQRNKYYIFQSFNQNENTSMYNRENYNLNIVNKISLYTYIKNSNINNKIKNVKKIKVKKYDFDSVMSYYNKRKSFEYIGIIDKDNKNNEVFKIKKIYTGKSNKKRGTGITSLTGATCHNAFDKDELNNIVKLINNEIKKLGLKTNVSSKLKKKNDTCNYIKEKLLFLETNAKNNTTYLMIPANHHTYKSPLNKK